MTPSRSSGPATAAGPVVVVLGDAGVADAARGLGLSGAAGPLPVATFDPAAPLAPEGAPVLALCVPAIRQMAADMAGGIPPKAARARWAAGAQAVLERMAARDGRLVAVHAAAALARPAALVERTGGRLGLHLDDGAGDPVPAPPRPRADYRMLAAQMLRADPDLRRLQARLDGSCLPLGNAPEEDEDAAPDADTVFAQLREVRGDALLDELAEARARDRAAAEARLALLDAARHADARRHADIEGRLQARIDRLHHDQTDLQAEFVRVTAKLRDRADRRAAARDAAVARADWLLAERNAERHRGDALEGSLSWRVTRPLRALSHALGLRRKRNG